MNELANDCAAPADERSGLVFAVRRSIRYHDRRQTHYDRLRRVTNFFATLLAGYVFIEVSGGTLPEWVKYVAAVGGLLSACDLVQGFATQADLHRNLKRRFLELEIAIDGSALTHQAACIERLRIESDEPPPFRALDLLCHNELCAAEGYDRTEQWVVRWDQRVTSQWWKWSNIGATAKKVVR